MPSIETLGQLLVANFVLLQVCMLVLWLVSIPLKDVSYIDTFWAAGFVIVAAATYLLLQPATLHQNVLLGITTVWGLRLASYLFLRWRREGPDPRYVALLKKAPGNPHMTSLTKVFLLQGVMLWIVSLPVQVGQWAPGAASLGLLAWGGVVLCVIGILFESIGDAQMKAFRGNPANAGQVMDRGLWRYTRHPNYFGDACVWWGLWLVAVDAGAGLWTAVGPALLTWTLVRWSGAALLERRLKRSRPGYEEYLARTSSFIPWPPKRNAES